MFNSVTPMPMTNRMRNLTWKGFNDPESEVQYLVYSRKLYRKLYKCFSFVGIAYNAVQILTILIWEKQSPPLSILTVVCVCLLGCVAVFLSLMIAELSENCQRLVLFGGVLLTAVELYILGALYNDSKFSLIWCSVLSFFLLGHSAFAMKVRALISILLLTPNVAFLHNYSIYDILNGTFVLKILNFIVYLIPILMIGMSQYLCIDMEIREQFSLQKSLREEKQAIITQLKDQERIVFSQLSYRIGFKMLSDVGEGRSIGDSKLYSWKYNNISILVIQFEHHHAPGKNLDVIYPTILHEILVQCEGLSKKYGQQILKINYNSMLIINDDTANNQTNLSVCMALAMMNKVRSISFAQEVDITAKAGIHYGDLETAVLGQQSVQLDVFGMDYKIARTLQELGNPGTIHCSQYVKNRLGINMDLKENLRMNRDEFLCTNAIKAFEVTEEFNETRGRLIPKAHARQISSVSVIISSSRNENTIKTTTRNCGIKCRRNLRCRTVSLLSAPVVLLCQLILGIVQQPLLIKEAVLYSISVLILVLIPCCAICRTRRQTKLKIFNIIRIQMPNNILWHLLYPVISIVLLLLNQTLTVVYSVDRRGNTYSNSSIELEKEMVYLQSNSSVLTLYAISSLVVNCGVKCACLIGSVLIFWAVDVIFINDSGYGRGQYVIKTLIAITGITICVLYLEITVEKTMRKMHAETVASQDENSHLGNLECKFKPFTSMVLPPGLQVDLEPSNSNYQNFVVTSLCNMGIMVVSCPKLCDQLVIANGTQSIRLLHDMISSFDQLLLDERFTGLTKIVCCQSTYIVVSGSELEGLKSLVALALTMHIIGQDAHRFGLRIGLHFGPVVTGCIGIGSRHFDIWGEAADIARLINLSCKEGEITVSNDCKEILEQAGYIFYRDERVIKLNDSKTIILYNLNQCRSS